MIFLLLTLLFHTNQATELYNTLRTQLPIDSEYLDILTHHAESLPRAITLQASGMKEWYKLWGQHRTGKNAVPFSVTNVPTWWRSPTFSCAEIIEPLGDSSITYQSYSSGVIKSDTEYNETREEWVYPLKHCARRIPSCQVPFKEKGRTNKEDDSIIPDWIQWPSNKTIPQHLYQDLAIAGFTHRTPTYVESNLLDSDTSGVIRGLYQNNLLIPFYNLTIDEIPIDLRYEKKIKTEQEIENGNENGNDIGDNNGSSSGNGNGNGNDNDNDNSNDNSNENSHNENFNGIISNGNKLYLPSGSQFETMFLYIGDRYSGTFMHQHGSSCSMTTGKRLWLLYHHDEYCKVNETIPFDLPKRCPRSEGRCMAGLHPLDVAQHYFELKELELAPLLHVQYPGDIFCFPRHWYHSTINLEPTVAVALTLDRRPDGLSHCKGEEPEVWCGLEEGGFVLGANGECIPIDIDRMVSEEL